MNSNVLVTGAGGPAAISFFKAILDKEIRFFAADIDPHAAGLYFVPPDRRLLVPTGDAPNFVERMLWECSRRRIDVLVPTVDSELLPLGTARNRFEQQGVQLLLASEKTLRQCLDKWKLLRKCQGIVRTPRTAIFDKLGVGADWEFPLIIKPRTGSGSRGVHVVQNLSELLYMDRGSHLLIQEYLPGAEYSVDVLATSSGKIAAVVPRERLKIDSGVAVTSRTVWDPLLMALARRVAEAIELTSVANIQFKRDKDGVPALLEVNARFPGTMPLTVASGVNMPDLSLGELLGRSIPESIGSFGEVAVVRFLQERFVSPNEIEKLVSYHRDCDTKDRTTLELEQSPCSVY